MAPLGLLAGREQEALEGSEVVLDVRGDDRPECGPGLDALDLRVERREDDDRLSSALVWRALELGLGVQRIQRHDDRAGLPRTELGNERLRCIRQEERDAIARFDAAPQKRPRQRTGPAVEVTVRDPGALEDQGRMSRPFPCRSMHDVYERIRRIRGQGRRDFGVVLAEPRPVCDRGAQIDRH